MATEIIKTQYLSVSQAATYMGISVSYLRELAYRQKIKHYRIGAKRLFTIGDIQNFMDSVAMEPKKKQKYISSGIGSRDINLIKRAVLND